MPQGGQAALQPVPATQIPADVADVTTELPMPTIVRFRQQSSPLQVKLDDMTVTAPGQAPSVRIASVGLGYRIVTEHSATFVINNSIASQQTVLIGKTFPFNLITNTSVQINGGATVYSLSGYLGLLISARNRRGIFGNNSMFGSPAGLSDSLVRISGLSNLTLTAASATGSAGTNAPLSGLVNVLVAASASTLNTLTVTWYTVEKLAFSRDSLLGALPLQNNSTFATLTRQFASSLTGSSAADSSPFYNVPGGVTVTLGSYTAKSIYKFWSVPGDPGLYQEMISNSYQAIEAPGNTFSSTGVGALTYNIPQNHYLASLHVVATDSTGAYLNPLAHVAADRIQYNAGSIIPISEFEGRKLAEQYYDYGASYANLPGYILWDGNDTTEDLNATDQAGWIDCYSTASPQFLADIAAGVSVPASYTVARESIVAGAVNIVGG